MTTRETEGHCLWCGGRLPDRQRRHGSARKFCNDNCRHQHRSALCQLGQETADQRFAAPGALRSRSSKARALHEGVESDEKVSTPIREVAARPEPLEALPHDPALIDHPHQRRRNRAVIRARGSA